MERTILLTPDSKKSVRLWLFSLSAHAATYWDYLDGFNFNQITHFIAFRTRWRVACVCTLAAGIGGNSPCICMIDTGEYKIEYETSANAQLYNENRVLLLAGTTGWNTISTLV